MALPQPQNVASGSIRLGQIREKGFGREFRRWLSVRAAALSLQLPPAGFGIAPPGECLPRIWTTAFPEADRRFPSHRQSPPAAGALLQMAN